MDAPDPLDFEALERLAAARSLHELLEAWAPKQPALAAGDADDRARLAVLQALRLDLALIADDPSMLFPCLYNRARWVDDPAAEVFYASTIEESIEQPEGPGPLGDRLERWRERRRAQGDGKPWARSLRPPPYRAGGPLLEEYRATLPGGPLAFSDDGEQIIAHGEAAVGWHRRTGRRLGPGELALLPRPASPRWRVERVDWGKCKLIGPGITTELIIDDETNIDVLAELPGDSGLVLGGWFDDCAGVIVRVDPPYDKVRWRSEHGSAIRGLAVTATGHILALDGDQVLVLDASTGGRRASVSAHSSDATLDPGGRLLATRGGDLIQIWDLAALARGEPERLTICEYGRVDAAFSPDRRRLLTGYMFCDAADGRLIAVHDLDGRGYLEGGPPERARRLADGRFVEMGPMRGVQVFDTEHGYRKIHDERRRYGVGRDEIEISPDGTLYVRYGARHEPEPGVELRRVDDGLLLIQLAIGSPGVARFSNDGSLLFVGSQDGSAALWAIPSGRLIARMDAHEGEVSDAEFSHDGSLVLTRGDHALRLWTSRGELVAEHTLDERDTHADRSAVLDAVRHLGGWKDFRGPPDPFAFRRRGGLGELVDSRTGEVVARVVTDLDLIGDGHRRWAYRSAHVALEDD